MKVYVLWHVYEHSDDFGEHDEEKLIGIYSTELADTPMAITQYGKCGIRAEVPIPSTIPC